MKLAGLKAFLIDLDGTLQWRGQALENAAATIAHLRRQGFGLRFLTNMDSKPPSAIADELRSLGFDADVAEVFSPARSAVAFMRSHPGKSCYCLVSGAVQREFDAQHSDGEHADYVIVGDVRDRVTYPMLNRAFRCIMNGAEILALQKGRYFYTKEGINLDTGAFVQLLEYASGKTARVLGKPSPDFFKFALDDLGCQSDEVAVIGDDVEADIVGGKAVGLKGILVRTGKFNSEALANSPVKPDLVLDSIADVPAQFNGTTSATLEPPRSPLT